jgi:two-component sensor histidine kinase
LQDITARREAELALEAAIAAEAANRAKSLFLSNMSHELRTPLNAVLGFNCSVRSSGALAPIQEEHVKDIIAGGQHLLRLINDILDLAKIDGGADLAIKDVMLDDVMREAVALVRPMTMDRKIALECDARPGTVLRADAVRLKQALLNLLANAIKYNRNSGRIVVTSAEVGDGYLRISVADTGIGIPETRHAEVFRPFSRLSANRQSVEGTGIGLALTKRLIEAMNGRIGFSSSRRGSTFWIELPLAGRFAGPAEIAATGEAALNVTPGRSAPLTGQRQGEIRSERGIIADERHVRLLAAALRPPGQFRKQVRRHGAAGDPGEASGFDGTADMVFHFPGRNLILHRDRIGDERSSSQVQLPRGPDDGHDVGDTLAPAGGLEAAGP